MKLTAQELETVLFRFLLPVGISRKLIFVEDPDVDFRLDEDNAGTVVYVS